MITPPRLHCEQCRKAIFATSAISAIEVIVERDAGGRVVGTLDGYQVLFHESCWNDLQARRVYNARTFRRPRAQPS